LGCDLYNSWHAECTFRLPDMNGQAVAAAVFAAGAVTTPSTQIALLEPREFMYNWPETIHLWIARSKELLTEMGEQVVALVCVGCVY
jgi:hypothetical protein